MRPVTMLSDAALPVMILVLGMQLERATQPKRLLVVGMAVCVSLVIAPLVALGMTTLLGVSGPAPAAAPMYRADALVVLDEQLVSRAAPEPRQSDMVDALFLGEPAD